MIIKLKTKHVLREKQKALSILRQFKANLPKDAQAIIAGGAPRDWHHGWGCRDIDIFYHVPNRDYLSVYDPTKNEHVKCHLNIKGITQPFDDEGYADFSKDMSGYNSLINIHEYEISRKNSALRYRKVQLIELNIKPIDYVHLFPLSLSHIYMGTDGVITALPAYRVGYNSKAIYELHRRTWNYHYLNKVIGRFPEYAFFPLNWKPKNVA